jgi:predicted metal-binding membrane protein
MGLAHASYCLGCCWLLMIVLFVAGAMSALWMGLFAGLIVAEKASPGGEQLARGIGIVAVAVGAFLLAVAAGMPIHLPLGALAPFEF